MGGNTLAFGMDVILGGIPAIAIGASCGLICSGHLFGLISNSRSPQIRKKWIAISNAICLGSVLLGFGACNSFETSDRPPRDEELLAVFASHWASFSGLVEMAVKDKKLTRVDADWTSPESPGSIGVSPERIQLYRSLALEAKVPRGFTRRESGEIQLMYWGVGSAVSDDIDKGFAYLESPPAKALTSLDGHKFSGKGPEVVYRHIRGPWYLYLQFIPD